MRKKRIWKGILVLVVLILLIAGNAIYFLACHQYKTVEKIEQGKGTNLYEKASILTLHAGICTVGSLYCPDAGWANLKMLTSRKDTIYLHSKNWLSPEIRQRFKENKLGRMAWNGNKDYAISSEEKDAAILLNYCYLKRREINGKLCYAAECHYTWERPSRTQFNLGFMTITVYEQLFYELEKCGILHPYTLVCYYETL